MWPGVGLIDVWQCVLCGHFSFEIVWILVWILVWSMCEPFNGASGSAFIQDGTIPYRSSVFAVWKVAQYVNRAVGTVVLSTKYVQRTRALQGTYR